MLRKSFLVFLALGALSTSLEAAQRAPSGPRETHACRLGTEDRHARIAIVTVGGKMTEFAYYSKWKPRTCSVYVQRSRDSFSKWSDNGNLTTVNLAEGKGDFLIEHQKNGTYRLEFRGIDRERYCGMDGKIEGYLVIKKNNPECELAGIMDEGTPLGQAHPIRVEEDVAVAKPPSAPPPVAASAPAPTDPAAVVAPTSTEPAWTLAPDTASGGASTPAPENQVSGRRTPQQPSSAY